MKKSKIKIVYGLPSFSIGGIENQLTQQFPHFNTDEYEIHLVTLFHYEGRPDLYEKIPQYIKIYKFNFKGYFDFKNYKALYRSIKEINPDIVISSMFAANAVFRIFKLFFDYKIITREHNTYTDRTILHKMAENILSVLSDQIVAVSKDVADFYSHQNKVDRKNVRVIHNGIDLEKIENFKNENHDLTDFKKEIGFESGEHAIINVARLKKQKNHEMLIDAFSDFQKLQDKYKLFILGDGQEKDNLTDQIAGLELEHKIALLGFRKDVYNFYSMSDFFVLSSLIEGFPNVFLEAMAFGLPVITTSVPGANEVIAEGKNGFIVRDKDELLIKMFLLSSLNESEMALMRKECFNTAKGFDVKRIVKEYEVLFNQLLNSQ